MPVEYFLNHPEKLGGPGMIVEIDESLFARRKYNCSHVVAVAEKWIMGGYDIQTGWNKVKLFGRINGLHTTALGNKALATVP